MKQQKMSNISWVLIMVVVISLICPMSSTVNAEKTTTAYEKQLSGVTAYLKKNVPKPEFGNEWVVLTMARNGMVDEAWYKAYYDSVYAKVKETGAAADGTTFGSISNDARTVIALSSIGVNSQKMGVNGVNLLGSFYDYDCKAVKEDAYAIYTAVYMLIAFDTNEKFYYLKALDKTTPEGLAYAIAERFDKEKGYIGFHDFYTGEYGIGIDATAMAVQALAPRYNNAKIKPVIDKALTSLSECQNSDGTYGIGYDDKVCTTAQVLVALSSCGIDTETDSRFIKNGNSALDGLLSYAKEDGSIVMDGAYNPLIDCEQAAYALVSYDRMKKDKNTLFDMSDAECMFLKTLAKTAIKKTASPAKKQINVRWKKKSGITGYELQVSNSAAFKKTKTNSYKVSKKDTEKLIKKSLKSKKTYYVRMRTYKNVKVYDVDYKAYSEWTPVKKIKVK